MSDKKFILIQNDGEIETNSFELIGASTKRGQSGKIGFFGSGLKYSIAYMMRKEIEFRIFSGTNELKFSTSPETLKGQTFERICINGSPTSYTVTMGPTWKEDWYVLREIYCNALDESNCIVVKDAMGVAPESGKTRIYIEKTSRLDKVMDCWDRYFADERVAIFEYPDIYTSSLGVNDGAQAFEYRQSVKVYNKTAGVLYRRGINVHEHSRRLYDYDFLYVDINEDRTAKSSGSLDYSFLDMMGQFVCEAWVKSVLNSGKDEMKSQEYNSLSWPKSDLLFSEKWVRFSIDNTLVVREISGKYEQEITASRKDVYYLPAAFAKQIKTAHPATSILGMGSIVNEMYLTESERTSKQDFLIKEVLRALSEMQYEVIYDIHIATFESENVLGHADTKEKKIYLAKELFDMGRREIAMTLIEENEHIKSNKGEETRAFQTHLISQWLTAMENSTALFL
jgi:hypothetical protein